MNTGRARSRRPSSGFGRALLRSGAYTLAGAALLAVVILAGVRVLLPELRHYRAEIEGWVSQIVGQKVVIGEIAAHWRGWTPVLRINDVRFVGGETTGEAQAHLPIQFADLTFSVDPLELLRSGTLQPGEINVSGASFAVVRQADGAFSVQGLEELSPGDSQASSEAARWLLNQKNISLRSSRILWIDEKRRMHALPLTNVALRIGREGERRRFSGSIEFPGAGQIDFNAVVSGDPLTPSWSGSGYVAVADFDLDRLGLDARRLGAERFSGIVSGTIWSTWVRTRLTEAEGMIRAQSPGITNGANWRGFDEMSASFKVKRIPRGWRLATRDLVVATRNGLWPRSSAGVNWISPRDGRDGVVVVSADFVRLEDLGALVTPGGDPWANLMFETLLEAAPRGVIEQLHVSAPITDRVDFEGASARGQFTRLRIGPRGWPISVDAASGWFEASTRGLAVEVVAGDLRANAPGWLAHPFQGKELAGLFTAIPAPEGIRVRFEKASLKTPVGTMVAQGWVLAPRDESKPKLSIVLELGASTITAVRGLLADRALPRPAAHWLEAAAPTGHIRGARLLFHGPLSESAFSTDGAQFEATAQLALPALHYAPDWPEITDASGTVRFDGSRLETRIESGRIFESGIREIIVAIEDVNSAAPVVQASGRVEGASSDVMRFLAESPLREETAGVLEDLAPHGESAISFGIMLPLEDDEPAAIKGEIALVDNRIDISGFDRGLEAVSGVITFRDDDIESDAITATYLGEPIRAVLGASPEDANTMRLSISGRMTQRQLAEHLRNADLVDPPLPDDSALFARLHGVVPWSAAFDFPRIDDGAGNHSKWRFTADLAGASLDLPPPFGKESGTARVLNIDSRTAPGVEQITEVRYGDLANAVFRLAPDADQFRLDRGAIRLNTGAAALPDAPGVTVHGVLPTLDADAWSTLFEDAAAHDAPSAGAPALDHVREASIDTGSFIALGARFPDTRMRATRGAHGGWRLGLAGRLLEGEVHIPRDPGAEPVTADFERFIYEPDPGAAHDEPRNPDPRTVPALSFSTRRLVLDGIDFGQAAFTTTPSERGMRIEQFNTRSASFASEGTGRWSLVDAKHRTEFKVHTSSGELGRMLDSLGFDGDTVAGGATKISMHGSWMGAPADFALERLNGIMHFQSDDGRLLELEPGVTGRVFGLLTVTSLPRRLILDFSDFFGSGFEYDRLEGNFAIEHGHAYTHDLFMDSDTARFEIAGRTGFVDEDYDKIVTVTPKISSALPFLPLWLAENFFNQKVFDKAFSYQYTITGTWDAPLIEPVKIPAPALNSNNQPQEQR